MKTQSQMFMVYGQKKTRKGWTGCFDEIQAINEDHAKTIAINSGMVVNDIVCLSGKQQKPKATRKPRKKATKNEPSNNAEK